MGRKKKQKRKLTTLQQVRHKDKTKYSRKVKHKKRLDDER